MQRAMIQIAATTQPKALTGATLIEVMVALVIMSIGLLGLASLQLSGVSNNSNSEKRTQAAILSNDLVERMRANPDEITTAAYATALPATANFNCTNPPATVCEDSGGTGAADCTPSLMTGYDAYTAWCDAKTLLPNGKISVVCSDQTGTTQACPTSYRTITVQWDNQTETGFTPKTLTTTFRP
jgi:type IV pilus modification protein PilV